MSNWIAPAILALFCFGLWGLFTKLSILFVDSKSALVYQSMGVFMVGLIMFGAIDFKPASDLKGLGFAIATGVAYCIGCFFFLVAANKGRIETVVTLTALYPAVTMILSYIILREALNLKPCLGIGLALVAIYLMSY
jgi:bacterial/archaeal transporter family protein